MIVACPCGKKFNLDTSMIPEDGRLLQCGFCDRKWYFTLPLDAKDSNDNDFKSNITESKKDIESENKKIINDNAIIKKNNNISFLSILSLLIISILALIILLDTFKYQIEIIIPNFNSYLINLYVTINDIYLFLIDLIR